MCSTEIRYKFAKFTDATKFCKIIICTRLLLHGKLIFELIINLIEINSIKIINLEFQMKIILTVLSIPERVRLHQCDYFPFINIIIMLLYY